MEARERAQAKAQAAALAAAEERRWLSRSRVAGREQRRGGGVIVLVANTNLRPANVTITLSPGSVVRAAAAHAALPTEFRVLHDGGGNSATLARV